MQSEEIKNRVVEAIDDMKGLDIRSLHVGDITSVADWMVIASGTSNRHVKSLANNVRTELKDSGVVTLGTEGEETGEWVLVDFGDVIVHIMQPETRRFYDLESLWGVKPNLPADADI